MSSSLWKAQQNSEANTKAQRHFSKLHGEPDFIKLKSYYTLANNRGEWIFEEEANGAILLERLKKLGYSRAEVVRELRRKV